MLIRLIITFCLFSLLFSGCGGDKGTATPIFSIPAATELEVYGIAENAVINRDYLYITVDRSKSFFRNYTTFEYTIDNQLSEYKTEHFNDPINKDIKSLTIPIFSGEGSHQFAIRGVLQQDSYDGLVHQEYGKKINFRVEYKLDNVAKGKYIGDRTVYGTTPLFNNMQVEFVTYSASRPSNNIVSSGMMLSGVSTPSTYYTGSSNIASAININQAHTTVQILLNSNTEFLRASGTGYDHFMELMLLQGSHGAAADKQGDLRLYRSDSGSKILSAFCSSMKGYRTTTPERQAVITLHSFDSINFIGHLRLWNLNSSKVWTYQVSAYADPKGLTSKNNALILWLSTSTSPLDDFLLRVTPYPDAYKLINPSNPPNLPTSVKPGFITVVPYADGKFFINQLSLVLDDDFSDAAPNSISMKASYKP